MNQSIRFCTTTDGIRLAYGVSGEGPPLVISATWLSHLEYQWRSPLWRPWLDAFGNNHTLLRHDSRGCGLSDRNVDNLSFENWVRDLECVVEASGFRRFAMVGTCWGGPIAIEYAVRHPERVSHLVLYGTYAQGRLRRTNSPNEVQKARANVELARLGWGQEGHPYLQVFASRSQPGGPSDNLRTWCEQQRATTSAETAIRMFQIAWQTDVRETARKLKCPALIVHPDRDLSVPIEQGRLLASLIPNSRFVQLDSENHVPLAHEPAWSQLIAEVQHFLAETVNAAVADRNELPLEELTSRERAVLEDIAKGLDNAEIARSLSLSAKTVRNHICRIFDKLRVKHRYQAIVLAREAGLGGANREPTSVEAGQLSRTLGVASNPHRDIGLNTAAFARSRVRRERVLRPPAHKSR
jgi:pimeloyl-ACP methyl ester carboxylesterase/DNA-binding CsgD family transcriptional regulator